MLPLLLALSLAPPQEPRTAPDRITLLRTGREEPVTLLFLGAEEVDYANAAGEVRTVPRKSVRKAAGPRADYAEFVTRLTAAYADQAAAGDAAAFADWCRAHGFLRDVELACWRELARDPEHAGAHQALGHLGGPGAWLVPLGDGRAAAWPDLLRLRAAGNPPWRFTTMHCTVEVAGPLDRAVIAAAAAELFYARAAELLRERARLWDLQQPLLIQVAGARPAGASASAEESGWDPARGSIVTWFDREAEVLRPSAYERLLGAALLDRSAAELTRSPPEVPYWLAAGLGIVLESATTWGSGLPTCVPGLAAQAQVDLQAESRQARSAGQIAILTRSDVQGPYAPDLRAHCANLLHYLLFAVGPDDQAAFNRWLAKAVRNRGGGSALREAFGARFDALDAAWQAWVRKEAAPRAGERDAPR